ncbi:GIN domain-containing protein [Congregibacter sp.]
MTAFSGFFALAIASPQLLADEETRRVEGLEFSKVVVLGSAKVEITQGDDIELQLRGPSKYLDSKPFYVKRGTLVLGSRKSYSGSKDSSHKRIAFRVVMPELEELKVKGSGKVYIKPFKFDASDKKSTTIMVVEGSGEINAFELRGSELEVRVEGSGDFRAVNIDVEDFEAVVTGSGNLFIGTVNANTGEFVVTGSGDLHVTEQGFVEELEVNVVGSGDARMTRVDCRRAETNIVGSGSASIGEVSEQLNASILGSGDVVYGGSPEVERVELGSGDVRRRD